MPDVADRVRPSDLLLTTRVVAVLRATDAQAYRPVVDVLLEEGIRSIELTMTTPGTLDVLASLVAETADTAEIGVGTVLTEEAARRALDEGAAYLVTPTVQPDVIGSASRALRPVYPGAFTPTEVAANWDAGASAVKIFPASLLGPAYLAALRGPLPAVGTIPSGGVPIADIPTWLAAGAIAVSLGSELVGDALRGGDLRSLARRAREVRRLADACGRPAA